MGVELAHFIYRQSSSGPTKRRRVTQGDIIPDSPHVVNILLVHPTGPNCPAALTQRLRKNLGR